MKKLEGLAHWACLLTAVACSDQDQEQISSESNWIRCSVIADCDDYTGATCGEEGFCVNTKGARIPASTQADVAREDADDAGAGDGSGDPTLCPGAPEFFCSSRPSCDTHECGALRRFDERGCPRPVCTRDSECGQDEVCFTDDCGGRVQRCEQFDEQCLCDDGSDDCPTSLGFCVSRQAAEDAPPTED